MPGHNSIKPLVVIALQQVHHFVQNNVIETGKRCFSQLQVQPYPGITNIAGALQAGGEHSTRKAY